MTVLLEAKGLVRDYELPRRRVFAAAPRRRALDGVSIRIKAGESLGIVGELGSGKSTLARLATGLEAPDEGAVLLEGEDIHKASRRRRRVLHRHIQMIFQDPYGSLDPRQRIGRIVAEPLHLLGLSAREARERVANALGDVGLEAADMQKFPHEFSGGQRQRVAIARALITSPKLVCADEPVSALDVSVQAQVLNLLGDLRERHALAYLFISHDLAVVAHITDRVAVLKDGRIVEEGRTLDVLRRPQHAYTQALIQSIIPPDPKIARLRPGRG